MPAVPPKRACAALYPIARQLYRIATAQPPPCTPSVHVATIPRPHLEILDPTPHSAPASAKANRQTDGSCCAVRRHDPLGPGSVTPGERGAHEGGAHRQRCLQPPARAVHEHTRRSTPAARPDPPPRCTFRRSQHAAHHSVPHMGQQEAPRLRTRLPQLASALPHIPSLPRHSRTSHRDARHNLGGARSQSAGRPPGTGRERLGGVEAWGWGEGAGTCPAAAARAEPEPMPCSAGTAHTASSTPPAPITLLPPDIHSTGQALGSRFQILV
eukprot:3085653-Rhodomonas_salina.3